MSLLKYTIPVSPDGNIYLSLPGILKEDIVVKTDHLIFNSNQDSFKAISERYEIEFIEGVIKRIIIR